MDYPSTFAAINEFGQVDYAPHNKGITPVFFIEPILDQAATEREGRTVYRDMERVRIYIAGDSLSAATHPVDGGIIARFREQYTAWKSTRSGVHITGMPLSKWPIATPAMIRECESLNIYSVEDLSVVSDSNISNLSEGRAVREKAIAWLKSATDGAAVMKYAAENERLRDDLVAATKRIEALERHLGGEPQSRGDLLVSFRERENIRAKIDHPETSKPRKAAKKKNGRKSYWTPERRKEAGERFAKARLAREVQKLYGNDNHAPSDVEA